MAERKRAKFKVGQRVRVAVRGLPHAVIYRFMADIEGGVVLDRQIQGFRCWNIEKLRPVARIPKQKAGRRRAK